MFTNGPRTKMHTNQTEDNLELTQSNEYSKPPDKDNARASTDTIRGKSFEHRACQAFCNGELCLLRVNSMNTLQKQREIAQKIAHFQWIFLGFIFESVLFFSFLFFCSILNSEKKETKMQRAYFLFVKSIVYRKW